MKKPMNKYGFILCAAVLFCALPVFAQGEGAAARTAAGCGPIEQMFDVKTTYSRHPIGQPEPGKALVYFFSDYIAAPKGMRVGVDGAWVGANNGMSYFFFQVAPGEHSVCTEWQSGLYKRTSERRGEAIHLSLEAGKTYYLRLTIGERRMFLELADEAEGHFLIGSSEYATSQPKK